MDAMARTIAAWACRASPLSACAAARALAAVQAHPSLILASADRKGRVNLINPKAMIARLGINLPAQ
jgi:hypothetical protein